MISFKGKLRKVWTLFRAAQQKAWGPSGPSSGQGGETCPPVRHCSRVPERLCHLCPWSHLKFNRPQPNWPDLRLKLSLLWAVVGVETSRGTFESHSFSACHSQEPALLLLRYHFTDYFYPENTLFHEQWYLRAFIIQKKFVFQLHTIVRRKVTGLSELQS